MCIAPTVRRHFFIEAWTTSILKPVFNCKNAADLLLGDSNDHTVKGKSSVAQLEKHEDTYTLRKI